MVGIKRGDVIIANLEPVVGSEQGGIRPVLIIQDDVISQFSPTTIIAPITSRIYTKEFLTNVEIGYKESKLKIKSTILLNQIRVIDKSRLRHKISSLNMETMKKIDAAIITCLGLS